MLRAPDEEAALELLHELSCTDGLPVVVPTRARVDRMALQSGLEPDLVLGTMGPANLVATVEKVAIAAVMAGCLPDHAPVVIAAVRAVLDPAFDLTEMQSTTHCTAPLVVVNGPARRFHGPIQSGFGALGPGFRANAAIGRALRLCLINLGGGRPGESDMALTGHPGKFTYCLGEAEEDSPWEPLHVARGFARDDSVVTVIGAEAPHSAIFVDDADDPTSAERLLGVLAASLAHPGTNNAVLRGGAAVVVLNPDHARALARAGLSRAQVAARLCQLAGHRRADLARLHPAAGQSGQPDDFVRAFVSPDDILLLVAGGPGLYSMVLPSWCAGPHRNRAVSVRLELGQSCAIPTASPPPPSSRA